MSDIFQKLDDIYEKLFSKDSSVYDKHNDVNFIRLRLKEIVGKYVEDKLVRRYMNLSLSLEGTGSGVKITEPWRAYAEQRFQILSIASERFPFGVFGMDMSEDDLIRQRIHYVTLLMVSQTFMWRSEVLDQVKDYPMPECVISREVLPFPFTYHTFETGLEINDERLASVGGEDLENISRCIDWVLFSHRPKNGIEISHNLGGINPSKFLVYSFMLKYGEIFPNNIEELNRRSVSFILSLFAFLKSPYIDIGKEKIPRHIRRSDDLDKETSDREINVVSLRKDVRDRIAHYCSESKEWKHRWWVRGHYRLQWYPSTQTHEMIWVAPYIKGKEDLPMLEKVYDVNR